MINRLIELLPTIGIIALAVYGSLGLLILFIYLLAKGNDK